MSTEAHPARIGRYEIQKPLGSGAMGDVFLAHDPNIGRLVAIKTVRITGGNDEDIADRRGRLLREARAAGKFVHPNVVALYDAGEANGLLYLAFEYVPGQDLLKRARQAPEMTLREVLRVIRETASALDYAQSENVVHRDIKPSNILLGPKGVAKVADFGIAKLHDQSVELTRTGSVVGSPQYMSPEQIRGEDLDGRSDIFSLGVVFYELLSRTRPFGGDTISTLVFEILAKEPPPIESLRPGLPAPLVHLVRSMMVKDRNHRVADAGKVVEAIQALEREIPAAELDRPASQASGGDALPTQLMPSGQQSAGAPGFAAGAATPPPMSAQGSAALPFPTGPQTPVPFASSNPSGNLAGVPMGPPLPSGPLAAMPALGAAAGATAPTYAPSAGAGVAPQGTGWNAPPPPPAMTPPAIPSQPPAGQPPRPPQAPPYGQPGQPGQPGPPYGQPGQPVHPGQPGQPVHPGQLGQPGQHVHPGQPYGQPTGQPYGQAPGQGQQRPPAGPPYGQGAPGNPGQPQPGAPGYGQPGRPNYPAAKPTSPLKLLLLLGAFAVIGLIGAFVLYALFSGDKTSPPPATPTSAPSEPPPAPDAAPSSDGQPTEGTTTYAADGSHGDFKPTGEAAPGPGWTEPRPTTGGEEPAETATEADPAPTPPTTAPRRPTTGGQQDGGALARLGEAIGGKDGADTSGDSGDSSGDTSGDAGADSGEDGGGYESPAPRTRPAPPPENSPWDDAASGARAEMETGLSFQFKVSPADAKVLFWAKDDRRPIVQGSVGDFDPKKEEEARVLELPGDGEYLLVFRHGDFPDYVVKVDAARSRGNRPRLLTFNLGRGGAAASSSGGSVPTVRVSRAIAFAGTPADAYIFVDGKAVGRASDYPGGGPRSGQNLRVDRGRHEVRIEATGYKPFVVRVEVAGGAPLLEQITYRLEKD